MVPEVVYTNASTCSSAQETCVKPSGLASPSKSESRTPASVPFVSGRTTAHHDAFKAPQHIGIDRFQYALKGYALESGPHREPSALATLQYVADFMAAKLSRQ